MDIADAQQSLTSPESLDALITLNVAMTETGVAAFVAAAQHIDAKRWDNPYLRCHMWRVLAAAAAGQAERCLADGKRASAAAAAGAGGTAR